MRGSIEFTGQAQAPSIDADAIDEHGRTVPTPIALEHRLAIRLDDRELATLRTLGTAPGPLALGWLRRQRIFGSIDEIVAVHVDLDRAAVTITSRLLRETGLPIRGQADAAEQLPAPGGTGTAAAGFGLAGGSRNPMAQSADIRPSPGARLSEEVLHTVIDRAGSSDAGRAIPDALPRCTLFSNAGDSRGEILHFAQDLDDHHTLDAISGQMWLDRADGADAILHTTAVPTPAVVARCAQMGVPFLLSTSGPTQTGLELARQIGITLIGRCRGLHYRVFTGAQGLLRAPVTALA